MQAFRFRTEKHCYALTSRIHGGNANAVTKTDCESVSESILKTYAHKLGDKYTDDTDGINEGYPILAFQTAQIRRGETL